MEKQAREKLMPEASTCGACVEMDFVYGDLCAAHQEKLEAPCAAATGSSRAAPTHVTPLGHHDRMLDC